MSEDAHSGTEPSSRLVQLMLGTAGHVDHGKTSLVYQLSGYECDRLKEEKQRGMSIDFRVAPCELPGIGRFGIIDVPGHEDFVRNMVAGASTIDLLLLIVAADDSVMPQTVEHLLIAKLLGVERLLAVVTKIDLVDGELLSLVEEEITEALSEAGYSGIPIFRVSNTTADGIGSLKERIAEELSQVNDKNDSRAFRMYVRHAFIQKGYGTVVTGVPLSGCLKPEESVELLPSGKLSGIRAIQSYSIKTELARAKVSTALNVRDFEPAELSRGHCFSAPGVYQSTAEIYAWLGHRRGVLLDRKKADLIFHSGTIALTCRLRVLQLEEGLDEQGVFVQISFHRKIALAAGDRFVLRTLSPKTTIGGGSVLSISPGKLPRTLPYLGARLQRALLALEKGNYISAEFEASTSPIVSVDDICWICQQDKNSARDLIKTRVSEGELGELDSSTWLVLSRLQELGQNVSYLLKGYHLRHPNTWGMKPELVAELLGMGPTTASELANLLVSCEGISKSSGFLANSDFKPKLSPREMKLRGELLVYLESLGLQSTAKGDIKSKLQMNEKEYKQLVKLLVDEGSLTSLDNQILLASAVEDFRRKLLELFASEADADGVLELSMIRDKTGASRNLAVLLLERFDREGLTKRKGSGRVLV